MGDYEKDNIRDAEVDEIESGDEGKKKNYRTEVILILIIGLLLGVMLKAESLKRVSVGFSDYKVEGGAQGYDMDSIEKKMIEENNAQSKTDAGATDNKSGGAGVEDVAPSGN